MFLKIIHFETDPTATSYTLLEGKTIHVVWEDEKRKTPLQIIVDNSTKDKFITIAGDRKKIMYILNNEGKTIEKIDYDPVKRKQVKEQMKK